MKKLLFLLLLCTSICRAQQRASDFTASGPITANGADCNTTNACITLHMPATNVGYSIAVSGSWTGTLTVEQSANNQTTWVSVTTTTSNTLYSSALTPGITDVRVRGSAAMTGTAQITISASGPATLNNITQTGGGGVTLASSIPATCTPGTSPPIQLTVPPYKIATCSATNIYTFSDGTVAVLPAVVVSNGANFTITSGSPIVTCPSCGFAPANVTNLFAASTWNGTDSSYPASVGVIPANTTILSFQSATQVTLSANATGNSGTTNANVGIMAFGPDGYATLHAAKVAQWDGAVCGFVMLPPYPFFDSQGDFNSAACPGFAGGQTTSHYAGVGAFGWSTQILLPPGFTCGAGTACFSLSTANGTYFNQINWNGLGEQLNLNGKNFFETGIDGSYYQLGFWGISARTAGTMNACVKLQGGYHEFRVITIDGCGDGGNATVFGLNIPAAVTAQTTFNNFVGNTAGSMVNVGAGSIFECNHCAWQMSTSTTTGIGLDISGTYYGNGDYFVAPVNVASSVYDVRTGGGILLNQANILNNVNANSNAITMNGTATVKLRDTLLQGGSTGGIVNNISTAGYFDNGGNVYNGTIKWPAPTCSTTGLTQSACSAVAGSTNEKGTLRVTAGGVGGAFTMTLTFAGTFQGVPATAIPPNCQFIYSNTGTGTWTAPTLLTISSKTTTAVVIAGTATTVNALTYDITYSCTATS